MISLLSVSCSVFLLSLSLVAYWHFSRWGGIRPFCQCSFFWPLSPWEHICIIAGWEDSIYVRATAKNGYTRRPVARPGFPSVCQCHGAISLANARPGPPLTAFQAGAPDPAYLPPPTGHPISITLPDYGRAIRPASHTLKYTCNRVKAARRRRRGFLRARALFYPADKNTNKLRVPTPSARLTLNAQESATMPFFYLRSAFINQTSEEDPSTAYVYSLSTSVHIIVQREPVQLRGSFMR